MEKRFCPNCGSKNVEPDFRHTNMLGEIIADQNKWLCKECDYAGWMPAGDQEEIDEDLDEMEFDPEEQEKIDVDLGRAYTKYFIYITVPAVIIYVLLLKIL
jgi:ribosomal protein S27AE